MGRVLSIDYGVRRTGLAVTDPLQIIAGGLDTVPTHQLMDYLKKYVEREPDSDNLPRVKAFAARLAKQFPAIPIELWDERYTSVLAHQTMLEGGLGKKARQNKALVDEISAVIILQGWMERRRGI